MVSDMNNAIKLTVAQSEGLSYYAYLTLSKEARKQLRTERKNPRHQITVLGLKIYSGS